MQIRIFVHVAAFELFSSSAEGWGVGGGAALPAGHDALMAREALLGSHLHLHTLREHVFRITHCAAEGDVPMAGEQAPSPGGVRGGSAQPPSPALRNDDTTGDEEAELRADEAGALLSQEGVVADADAVDTPRMMAASLQLRKYQQQALAWMLQREGRLPDGRMQDGDTATAAAEAGDFSHPLWKRCTASAGGGGAAAADGSGDAHSTEQLHMYFNPFAKKMSLSPPPRLHACSGGILADEMGLGKTIEVLALVAQTHGQRCRRTPHSLSSSDAQQLPLGGTLIVAPLSVVRQWVSEVLKFTGGGLRVLEHYGQSRSCSAAHMAQAYDVVVTSYGTLKSELLNAARVSSSASSAAGQLGHGSGPQPEGLYGVQWERVVLDEAHEIRNRSTDMAQACYALYSWHKWCLTGTPLQNSLDDLFSLLHFLQHEPWCEAAWWKKNIAEPFAAGDVEAVASVRRVLGPIMMRRTKDMSDAEGRPIVQLPPRHVQVVRLDMTPEERVFYDALYARSQLQFEGYMAKGVVSHKYAAMLTLLLRLRQACDHPLLVLGATRDSAEAQTGDQQAGASVSLPTATAPAADAAAAEGGLPPDLLQQLYARFSAGAKDSAPAPNATLADAPDVHQELPSFVRQVLAELRASGTTHMECPVCMMAPEGAVVATCCAKVFCRACLDESFKYLKKRLCPFCRQQLQDSDLLAVGAPAVPKQHTAALPSLESLRKAWLPSSKSTAIVQVLSAVQGLNSRIRALDMEDMGGGRAAKHAPPMQDSSQRSLSFATAGKSSPVGGTKRLRSQEQAQHSSAAGGAGGSDAAVATRPKQHIDTSAVDTLLEHPCSSTVVTKVVLFSQWTSMLDLLEIPLRAAGVCFRRLDGSMSQAQREKAVHAFKVRSDITVLLMSTKAAALGLNLTEANVALVMEPWFNPQVEEQAIGRVWRLGATRDVIVKRYIMGSTVEETMLELQAKKAAMARSALATGDTAASKLSVQDLMLFFRGKRGAP